MPKTAKKHPKKITGRSSQKPTKLKVATPTKYHSGGSKLRLRISKKQRNVQSKMLAIIFALVVFSIFGFSYMYKSAKYARDIYNQTVISADSLLAYDDYQIEVARIIGDNQQLSQEINGFQSAPKDLQVYAINDYKKLKKSCIVNGQIIGKVGYAIESVVYDKFALIGRDCNGRQPSILAKISGIWTVVYSSNVTIPCSLVNDFDLPKGVSQECTTNGVTYINPNP